MYSDIALKIYAALKDGIIKSSADFWRNYNGTDGFDYACLNADRYAEELDGVSLICAYDDGFPSVPCRLSYGEMPFFFAYRGDITLLKDRTKNVAVVGTLTPDESIISREKEIVRQLVKRGFNVVNGLAAGCDSAAHSGCLENGGKTIAFLPSPLFDIYPKRNAHIAERIVEKGGLVVTEYVTKPQNRKESIGRFILRDRLQAMFAANIILIASNIKGAGDSGSRHAMAKAVKYQTQRFVMYNEETDAYNPLFGLNRQLYKEGATILTPNVLNDFT